MREQLKEFTKLYEKSENDLKALQSVGQIVGEVLKQLTEDKCMSNFLLVINGSKLKLIYRMINTSCTVHVY